MNMFKNVIELACPGNRVLLSEANEADSNIDIFEMGKNLAKEVTEMIKDYCPGKSLGRLTFIGHSLGGLIIRAALPHLKDYRDKMHGMITLATPHLGLMYAKSQLVNAGMWVLKKWKRSISLE